MNPLYANFQQYFEIIIADTTEMLDYVYKLRHQVLCVERQYLDTAQCPDFQEKDVYDGHSAHVLLRYKPTNEFIGTVRLIFPDTVPPQDKLPVELYGQPDPSLYNIQLFPRSETAEISRFMVVSRFDRRRSDRRKEDRRKQLTENLDEKRSSQERRSQDRRSLSITLVLMAGVMRMSIKHNIRNWFSFMEPALNRLLGFYGLNFIPIGPLVNYYGMRRSYYVKVDDVIERMYKEHREAWEVVTDCGNYCFDQTDKK